MFRIRRLPLQRAEPENDFARGARLHVSDDFDNGVRQGFDLVPGILDVESLSRCIVSQFRNIVLQFVEGLANRTIVSRRAFGGGRRIFVFRHRFLPWFLTPLGEMRRGCLRIAAPARLQLSPVCGRRRVNCGVQRRPSGEALGSMAADLCARISGDLGALRGLLDRAGLDGASEILGEIVEEFDALADHVARKAGRE